MWHTEAAVAARFQTADQTGLNGSVVAFLGALTLLLLGVGGLVILIRAGLLLSRHASLGPTPLCLLRPRLRLSCPSHAARLP